MEDNRYDPALRKVTANKCLCCNRGRVYPWRIKITDEFVWVCDECDCLWKINQEFTEENVVGCSEHYFRNAYPDGITGLDWNRKVEALPYEEIAENVDQDERFPIEATNIRFYNSNRFFIFECSIPQKAFEQWLQGQRLEATKPIEVKPIEQNCRIPRYLFYRFLSNSLKTNTEEQLPDQAFHSTNCGLESQVRYRLYFKHIVYDMQERLYHYEISGLASKDALTEDALKRHALFYPDDKMFGKQTS